MAETSRLLGRRLGAQIALRRRAHQLSQDQLAEQLGVATETISRFERGATLPSLVTVQRLAEALGVRISDLLGESSVSTNDQVDVMLSWMRPLDTEGRAFVMDLVKRSCDFLKANKR